LCGLDGEWILGPPGVLGDQLVVKSFVTATFIAATSMIRRCDDYLNPPARTFHDLGTAREPRWELFGEEPARRLGESDGKPVPPGVRLGRTGGTSIG
jgi:hypothetical protein